MFSNVIDYTFNVLLNCSKAMNVADRGELLDEIKQLRFCSIFRAIEDYEGIANGRMVCSIVTCA